jgi:death-on-curing protein
VFETVMKVDFDRSVDLEVRDGILRDLPFLDGDKRAALLAARALLFVNGWRFEPDEEDEVAMIVCAAEGSVSARRLSRWFRDHSDRRA